MTQGIVSIRVSGQMLYKIVVGHDGMNALKVADAVRTYHQLTKEPPTVEGLKVLCDTHRFGCLDCLIILQHNEANWHRPTLAYNGRDAEFGDGEEYQRYFDTFHVAQFNPRWKYGTAPHVEVVDL